jgi:hypothetical protein
VRVRVYACMCVAATWVLRVRVRLLCVAAIPLLPEIPASAEHVGGGLPIGRTRGAQCSSLWTAVHDDDDDDDDDGNDDDDDDDGNDDGNDDGDVVGAFLSSACMVSFAGRSQLVSPVVARIHGGSKFIRRRMRAPRFISNPLRAARPQRGARKRRYQSSEVARRRVCSSHVVRLGR